MASPEFIKVVTPPHTKVDISRKTSAHKLWGQTEEEFRGRPEVLLRWDNISYEVKVKNKETKKKEPKKILQNVSGFAKPGEFVVIMGPSGSGKTSLLNCLSGLNSSCTGDVRLNGRAWNASLHRISSYVQQQDLFLPVITVWEHLTFQAALRMPSTMTRQEREDVVRDVMDELGLTKAHNTYIGAPNVVRGISGGESKRLALASEMLTDPALIFADEPTSGSLLLVIQSPHLTLAPRRRSLDSFMAETVVQVLGKLAKGGRTVLATVHQPSSEVFAIFDKLLFIADGRTAYLGAAKDSVKYFKSIGYPCPEYNNPSDYFMKQLSTLPQDYDGSKIRIKEICDAYDDHFEKGGGAREVELEEDVGGPDDDAKSDTSRRSSKYLDDLANSHARALSTVEGAAAAATVAALPANSSSYSASFGKQVSILTRRDQLNIVRNPMTFAAKMGQNVFLGLLIGIVYFQLDNSQTAVQSINGALFFIVVSMTMGTTMPVLMVFPAEVPLFMREHKNGMYSVTAYYLSKTIADLPFQVLFPTLFCVLSYWMIGLNPTAENFFIFVGICILVANTAIALGYMISSVAPSSEVAQVLGPMVILPFMIFGGFFLNTANIPAWLEWFGALSFIKYGFQAAAINQWEDFGSIDCLQGELCIFKSGSDVLRSLSIDPSDFGFCILMLIVLMLAFRILAFGFLFARSKKRMVGV